MKKNSVVEILRNEGPSLSSKLAKRLVTKYKISKEAARQRISRTIRQKQAMQLSYLTFPSNDRFLYLTKQYSSPDYWSELKLALINSNSCYGLAYSAIYARGGITPKSHFVTICGSPIKQKKHIAAETVLKNLLKAGIVKEQIFGGIGKSIILNEIVEQSSPEELHKISIGVQARILVETLILESVKEWLRNLGLASYDKVEIRGQDNALVSTFSWDLTAPSYLKAFSSWDTNKNKPIPAFITCDVLSAKVELDGIEPFLSKCRMLDNMRGGIRYFHMIVAERYSLEAFNEVKKSRLALPSTPESIFGKDIAEGLILLTEVLTDAAIKSLDLEKFNMLFSKLGAIEGAAGNLRGALFELFSAELTRFAFDAEPEINVICKADNKTAEIDVIAEKKYRKVYFIECKGYRPSSTISIKEVKKWLSKRIPVVRSWALSEGRWDNNIEFQFELWITGKLNQTSKNLIDKASRDTKKYKIVLRDSNDILELTKKTGNKALVKVFREQFLQHPLAEIERDINRMIPAKKFDTLQEIQKDDLDIEIPF